VELLRNGVINIAFKVPVYVHDLTFWTEKGKPSRLSHYVKITAMDDSGVERDYKLEDGDGNYSDCAFSRFLMSIKISLEGIKKSNFFGSPPSCQKIEILGFDKQDFTLFMRDVAYLIGQSKIIQSQLSKQQDEVAERERELDLKIFEHESIIDEIPRLRSERDDLIDRNVKTSGELSNANERLAKAEGELGRVQEQQQRLQSENHLLLDSIQENKAELDSILQDKSIFMEEFRDYVRQGRNSNAVYLTAAGAFFVLAAGCVIYLLSKASGLVSDYEILSSVSAFDLLLSRAPFALAVAAVVGVLLATVNKLIGRVFEIHQERLLLSKISILAKEAVSSAAIGLDLRQDEIFDKKTQLKGQLLKELLVGTFDRDPVGAETLTAEDLKSKPEK